MAETTNILETTHQSEDDPFKDNLEMQRSLQQSQAAAERLMDQAPQQDEKVDAIPSSGMSRGAKIGLAGGIAAGLVTGAIGGVAYGEANERAHQETETIVASSSFTPNPEYGNTDTPAQAAVQEMLEANGLDPNTFSYDDVRNELGNAAQELQESTGESTFRAGEPLDVDLITSTGVFGEQRTSIDITPSRVANAQDAAQPANDSSPENTQG